MSEFNQLGFGSIDWYDQFHQVVIISLTDSAFAIFWSFLQFPLWWSGSAKFGSATLFLWLIKLPPFRLFAAAVSLTLIFGFQSIIWEIRFLTSVTKSTNGPFRLYRGQIVTSVTIDIIWVLLWANFFVPRVPLLFWVFHRPVSWFPFRWFLFIISTHQRDFKVVLFVLGRTRFVLMSMYFIPFGRFLMTFIRQFCATFRVIFLVMRLKANPCGYFVMNLIGQFCASYRLIF